MSDSKNEAVTQFLEKLLIDDEKNFSIIESLRWIVFSIDHTISEKIIYSWIMFTHKKWDIGGIFHYKNHVSFEFSKGYLFEDPKNILEWTGKFRRHIKIYNLSQIEEKDVEYFVQQALKWVTTDLK